MKHSYKLFILIIVFLVHSTAYTKPLNKNNFQEAEEAYSNHKLNQAEALYLKVLTANPDHYLTNARLGSLYLNLNQPAKSVQYLKKALEMHKGYSEDLNQQLSLAYQLSNDYDNAITIYFDLLNREKKNSPDVALYQKKINECMAGKQLTANPLKVTINNLGALVNSASVDQVPVLTSNDKSLLFTSQRAKDLKKPGVKSDEDIFLINQEDKGWSEPARLNKPFNTAKHEAILAVTADGNKMYLYSNKEANGDIYESQKENGVWKNPVKLGSTINTRHHELSFTISKDGNFAFFSSDRPGGYGGLDIYMSISEGNGKWSEAINLGSNINTPYDDDAPFLNFDNSILYFNSKGHNSIGGYDIFKSTINGTVWSVAQNLGIPVNSPYDDAFYMQTQNGKMAYFSSDRPGGFGESDIYAVEAITGDNLSDAGSEEYTGVFTAMLDSQNNLGALLYPAATAPSPVIKTSLKLKGFVTDGLTRNPLNTRITLIDKTLLTTEAVLETDENGYFEIDLEKDRNYGLIIESDGYLLRSETLNLPERPEAEEIELKPMLFQDSSKSVLALQNVHFYPNHDYIKSYSLAELDWLYTYLLDNPNLDVVITNYINPEDTMQYKKHLNEKRAAAVIKYLRSKGLEAARVSYQAKTEKTWSVKDLAATGMIVNFIPVEE